MSRITERGGESRAPQENSQRPLQVGERFNPYQRFDGIFIPEAIYKYRGISPGAKLVYGRLCRYAGANGDAYPAVATLGNELGISREQTRLYLRELEALKFIQSDPEPGYRSHYFFLWHQAFSNGDRGTPRKAAPPQLIGGGAPPEDWGSTPPVNWDQRESSIKESKIRESGGWGGSLSLVARETPPNAKTKKNLPEKEKQKTLTRTPLANPEMEFAARIMERHGNTVDAETLLKTVLSELNGNPLAEFLKTDLETTTGRLSNPIGYYRSLARKVGRQHEAAGTYAQAAAAR